MSNIRLELEEYLRSKGYWTREGSPRPRAGDSVSGTLWFLLKKIERLEAEIKKLKESR